MADTAIFLKVALSQIPRILGFIDNNPLSKTYGCFDRYYWHYKILDFPNSRFQEAALVLSLTHSINHPENRFYKSALIKKWAMAGINFWGKMRHLDGSTDESYPFERHFCSTAFSLFAVTEALLLFNEKAEFSLANTGKFIISHNNLDVANQMTCAALALYNLYLLTGEQEYKSRFEDKLELLLGMQSKEGFFMEYGGFDAGYDSITLSLLAVLYKKTGKEAIKNAALHCIKNLDSVVEDDGYFAIENMSRKMQFLYPFGFAAFNSDIVKRIENGLQQNVIVNPAWLDDRYCIPLITNYLLAH
jgi:hypothetical protein